MSEEHPSEGSLEPVVPESTHTHAHNLPPRDPVSSRHRSHCSPTLSVVSSSWIPSASRGGSSRTPRLGLTRLCLLFRFLRSQRQGLGVCSPRGPEGRKDPPSINRCHLKRALSGEGGPDPKSQEGGGGSRPDGALDSQSTPSFHPRPKSASYGRDGALLTQTRT